MTSLREAWDSQAEEWAAWARAPDHDHFYWRYNLPHFLELVPKPGALTIEVGCGEGRVGRALMARGHRVIGVDASRTLARLAAAHEEPQLTVVADAAALPLAAGVADVAVAFMSLQDVDDLEGSVGELGRVLRPGGVLCAAIVYPLTSAGGFASEDPESPYVIGASYVEEQRRVDCIERDGLRMVFNSIHRPLAAYAAALRGAGLMIDVLSEPVPDEECRRDHPQMSRQHRIPCFLHLRAVRLV